MAQYSVSRGRHYHANANKDLHEVVMIADEDGNIINTFGAASNVIISAGDLAGYAGVHKYGAVFGTSSSGWSTVWTAADTASSILYPWDIAANTITVVSSSGSDTGDITIQGLDADYNFVEETLTLTGTSPVAGSVTYSRVNRAFMNDATNIGKIQVKNGTTVVTEIAAGYGQTLQCFYTIPEGKTGYMLNIQASANKNQETTLSLFARPFGGAFRTQSVLALYQNNQRLDFPVPLKFNEKTDIDLRVNGSANAAIAADFSIILVDNI